MDKLDPRSDLYRQRLSTLMARLFTLWEVPADEHYNLLGLPPNFNFKTPLPNQTDVLDRAGLFLGMHRALRTIFPHNRGLAYRWMNQANMALNDLSPLQVIAKERFRGILAISDLLQQQLER